MLPPEDWNPCMCCGPICWIWRMEFWVDRSCPFHELRLSLFEISCRTGFCHCKSGHSEHACTALDRSRDQALHHFPTACIRATLVGDRCCNTSYMGIISTYNVLVTAASPPCQSWSVSGSGLGLLAETGIFQLPGANPACNCAFGERGGVEESPALPFSYSIVA